MDYIQIFASITGVIFLTLQVLHNKWMWLFQILTSASFAYVFGRDHLWATMSLNIYYVLIAILGIFSWRRVAKNAAQKGEGDSKTIHLVRVTPKIMLISLGIFVGGSAIIIPIISHLDDPRPVFDGMVLCMSAIGSWWLTRSHIQQWFIWMVADTLLLSLALMEGLYPTAATNAFYVIASFVGYFNWKKKGVYVE